MEQGGGEGEFVPPSFQDDESSPTTEDIWARCSFSGTWQPGQQRGAQPQVAAQDLNLDWVMQGWEPGRMVVLLGNRGRFCLPAAAFLPSRATLLIVCFPSLALQLWLYSVTPFLFIPFVLQWLGSVLAFFN